jgi:AraC-like DNA-binding protein
MKAGSTYLRSVLLDLVAGLGLDIRRVLHLSGLAAARFERGPAVPMLASRAMMADLTTDEVFTLWRAVEEVAETPEIGLQLGSMPQIHQLNIMSAAIPSPNLRIALAKLARYASACCGELARVEIATGDGEEKFTMYHLDAERRTPATIVDSCFASVIALVRRGTALPLRPLRIELARCRAQEAMLKRHFGCDVLFDAPIDSIVFEQKVLAHPFVTRDDALSAMFLPEIEGALYASRTSPSLEEDVRFALRRYMFGERPSIEIIASEMHLSSRTLQRHLVEAGTSYQKLLDGVRHNTARRLLLDTDLRVGDVAYLLGFGEVPSFVRVFHGWCGAPPSRWRARQRERSVSAA